MTNCVRLVLTSLVFILTSLVFILTSPLASAYQPGPGIDRFELEQSIESQSGVDHATAVRLVDALAAQFNLRPGERLPIRGWLTTRGFNFGLLRDSDTWVMNAYLRDDQGRKIEAQDLYEVEFDNGGVKAELSYRFMWTLIPWDMDVKHLDGAVFGGPLAGRGLGFHLGFGVSGTLGVMHGQNRRGFVFNLGIGLGADAGVTFPRMTFHLRRIQ